MKVNELMKVISDGIIAKTINYNTEIEACVDVEAERITGDIQDIVTIEECYIENGKVVMNVESLPLVNPRYKRKV